MVDEQGNIRRLVDTRKNIKEEYNFTAYGENRNNITKYINPWQYQQKRVDFETGVILFGKRYYDPELGRWLTTDPTYFTDSMNLYQYVWNNPLKFIDSEGEFAFAIPIITMAFGGGILAPVILPAIGITAITAAVAWGSL